MTNGPYIELLEAAIRHVEGLKNHGETCVPVAPATLEALKRPVLTQRIADPPAPPSSKKPPAQPPVSVRSVQPAAASSPAPASSKGAAMEALRQRLMGCAKCAHLAASRKNIVFGVGNPDARLMFVGEAPGADEDRLGEPFVGAAGQLLNKIISAMGLHRNDVYIANILKCRPDTPGQTTGNRKPTPEEMSTCISYLQEQIRIVQPKVIVALGATALEGLLGNVGGITKARGKWRTYEGTDLMPTYHPSFLLHNQANTVKRQVWEDMMQVMEKLGLTISEKQRGYFL